MVVLFLVVVAVMLIVVKRTTTVVLGSSTDTIQTQVINVDCVSVYYGGGVLAVFVRRRLAMTISETIQVTENRVEANGSSFRILVAVKKVGTKVTRTPVEHFGFVI